MRHRVEYSPAFLEDVREQVAYLRKEGVSQETLDRWFGELFDAIDGLHESPKRHPIDEIQTETIGSESRKLVFRERYLVFYRVDEADRRVSVDVLIHGARDRERIRDSVLGRVRRGRGSSDLGR